MKRLSIYAGTMGGLMVAGSGYNLAQILSDPTSLFWVNVATVASSIAWLVFGVFLVVLFIKIRQKEDVEIKAKPTPDSLEDIKRLNRQRNWILGFVLLIEVIASVELWPLNDYTAGFTVTNIAVMFDLLFSIFFLCIIVELFRCKSYILKSLFYVMVVYMCGWIVFYALKEHWFSVIASILFSSYFLYAIKVKVNRRNHRIAHLVVLPALIIFLSTGSFFDKGDIPDLIDKETLAEQQFSNESNNISSAYQLFLQREIPTKKEIDDVRGSIEKRDKKIEEIISFIHELEEEYKKQFPTISQKKTLEGFIYFLRTMETHRAQSNKIEELMVYSETVNFNAPTDEQVITLAELKDEVESFSDQFTEIQFERNNANID